MATSPAVHAGSPPSFLPCRRNQRASASGHQSAAASIQPANSLAQAQCLSGERFSARPVSALQSHSCEIAGIGGDALRRCQPPRRLASPRGSHVQPPRDHPTRIRLLRVCSTRSRRPRLSRPPSIQLHGFPKEPMAVGYSFASVCPKPRMRRSGARSRAPARRRRAPVILGPVGTASTSIDCPRRLDPAAVIGAPTSTRNSRGDGTVLGILVRPVIHRSVR